MHVVAEEQSEHPSPQQDNLSTDIKNPVAQVVQFVTLAQLLQLVWQAVQALVADTKNADTH